MESKDPTPGDNPGLRTRSRLQLDASKFPLDPPVQEPATPSTGASSAAFPIGRPRSLTSVAPLAGPSAGTALLVRHRAATVANPPKSAPPGGVPEKEKRKRSRVTPEQLAHLERIFALDRSPTAAKRKEISEMLGMQERQTQIWFQNRRAKAKTLEGKGKGFRGSPTSGGDSPPDTPPDFVAPDVDLQSLIHEDEPVTFIPCSDLSIGSWRRISASLGQHDLVAYVSPARRCLTWFIYSNGYGFKMEIPFDTITSTSFTGATPGQGLASFFLSRPPLFYLESTASPSGAPVAAKVWKKCADWTEGQQATQILRHDLVGAAVPLVNALKSLPPSEHPPALAAAAALPHYSPPDAMPTMHIPQPPMAALDPLHAHLAHGRKRSFSGPPALSQSSHDLPHFALLGAPPGAPQPGTSPSSYPPAGLGAGLGAGSIAFPSPYAAPLFRGFPAASHHAHPSLEDFTTVPISHAAAPRPYSASSVDTRFAFDPQAPSYGGATDAFASSSPALLTSAFDPATLQRTSAGSLDMDAPPFAGAASESGQRHDPPFEATLSIASQHDPPHPPPQGHP